MNRHVARSDPGRSPRTGNFLGAVFAAASGLALAGGHVAPWEGGACHCKAGLAGWTYVFLDGAVAMPLGLGLAAFAPRYISASEVAFVYLGDIAMGTFWVWLVIGEIPTLLSGIGGACLLLCLAANFFPSAQAPAGKRTDSDAAVCKSLLAEAEAEA